jgi:hypothetical protein
VAVESACKVVVQGRMKQGGTLWSHHGVQAMLALRSTVLSDRWDGPTSKRPLTKATFRCTTPAM